MIADSSTVRRAMHLRQLSASAAATVLTSIAVLAAGRAPGPQAVRPSAQAAPATAETALDRYVAAPDPAFRYSVAATRPGTGHTAFVLDLVSQRWLTTDEVDKPEWHHWLTIIRPDTVRHDTAFLFVTGGNAEKGMPQRTDAALADIAVTTQSVVVELRLVPNQPLVFARDGRGRVEDEILAYAWDKFLRTGDERWSPRLPMTKAVVRAMDAVTAFCAKPSEGGPASVEAFVVAGASKRGWTTWTTAAVDRRVVAIAPIVIDVLNVEQSFDHHWRAYGFYAPAVKDYEEAGIMGWLGTPQFRALMRIEDPYEYRARYTMPKFLVNATGDQFFLPDSWRFYYDDLPGETLVRYVPNADHGLKDTDAVPSIAAFYASVLNGTPRPKVTWMADRQGKIRVTADRAPSSVKVWRASNPAARDFRIETLGPVWESEALAPVRPGTWETTIDTPVKGWSAGLIELRFDSGTKYPFVFTSGVTVVPDRLPFPSKARTGRPPAEPATQKPR